MSPLNFLFLEIIMGKGKSKNSVPAVNENGGKKKSKKGKKGK